MNENKYDWKIHKILDEAKRVYICPARGNCKLYNQLELYVDLLAQNKDVKVIRAGDVKKAVTLKDVIIDKDLYFNTVSPWRRDALDKYFEEEMKKWLGDYKMDWKPKIAYDSTVVDDAPWRYWQLWNAMYDGFIVRPEIEEDECVTE